MWCLYEKNGPTIALLLLLLERERGRLPLVAQLADRVQELGGGHRLGEIVLGDDAVAVEIDQFDEAHRLLLIGVLRVVEDLAAPVRFTAAWRVESRQQVEQLRRAIVSEGRENPQRHSTLI